MTGEIIARANEAWAAVTVFADTLTRHEREVLRNTDGWSVKDHIAHLGAWKRSFVLWLEGRSGHAALRVPEALFRADDLDAINAASRDAWADEPWEAVRAEANAAHEAWMAHIATLDDASLARPLGRHTVARALPDITWDHDLEHLGWMHSDLERTPPMETLSPEKQERDRLIAEARRLLEEVVAFGAALPPEARLVPRTPEGWSVTDHLTHLAAWHRWLREELHGRPGAPELGFTAEEFAPLFPQFDPINARIHETFAGTSWDDAVISLRASHADLETILKRATSEELRSPALWADSLTTIYHNFTLHHVGEHLGWMREQVAATSPV